MVYPEKRFDLIILLFEGENVMRKLLSIVLSLSLVLSSVIMLASVASAESKFEINRRC